MRSFGSELGKVSEFYTSYTPVGAPTECVSLFHNLVFANREKEIVEAMREELSR